MESDSGDHDDTLPTRGSSTSSWSCGSIFIVLLVCAALLGLIVTTNHRLLMIYSILVAAVPMFISIFVLRRMGDDSLSVSHLIEQIFISAVPAYFAALVVESLILILSLSLFFFNDLRRLYNEIPPTATQQEMNYKLQSFIESLPLWKLVVFSVFSAFILAALTEETAKLVVGLRFKSFLPMSGHNAVAFIVAGALGLATTEHFAVVVKELFSGNGSESGILSSTAFVFFRASLAFPVHLGCALLVGVALSKKVCSRQPVAVFPAFLLAVLAHGTFDVVGLLAMTFDSKKMLPQWFSSFGVIGIDVLITIALMVLCRRQYLSLEMDGYESVNPTDQV